MAVPKNVASMLFAHSKYNTWSTFVEMKSQLEENAGGDAQRLQQQIAQLEYALAESRAALELTMDGIITTDRHGRVTSHNERFWVMWDVSPDIIEARNHQEITGLFSRQLHDPSLLESRIAEVYVSWPEETYDIFELKDGRVLEHISKIQRIGGRELGRAWVCRDISERWREEALRFRLAAVVESSDDAIISKSVEGVIKTWNSGAERIFGYTAEEVIGKSIYLLFPADRVDEEPKIIERFKRGERIEHYETVRLRKDGKPIDVSLTVSPIKDASGKIIGASKIARDITERKQVEKMLRKSEEHFRHLANAMPQIIWTAQPNGRIDYYNKRCHEYAGIDETHGDYGWLKIVHPDDAPLAFENYRAAIGSGQEYRAECRLKEKFTGSYRWFLVRAMPIRDDEGKTIRWFGSCTDIDELKHAEMSLQEEARVLELLNKTCITLSSQLDLQALMQVITDTATELSGAQFGAFFYNTTDVNGDAFQLYTLSGAPRSAFDKFGQPHATALFAPTFKGEGIIRCNDVLQDSRYGKTAPHYGLPPGHMPVRSYLSVPVTARSGEVIGGLFFGHPEPAIFSVRTERTIAALAAQATVAIDNARLYESSQKLAEERNALLDSERAARTEAERMSALKDEFLATLSHELRTPLSAILGWAHILRERSTTEADLKQGLETIERSARVQAQLIEDLLDMSRITSGKVRLDIQQTLPFSFVEEAIETVTPAAEAKGIKIERALNPYAGPISGDPNRLQQVVWNLLSNAIKFTPKGGKVRVTLSKVGSHVEIAVTDTGAGISGEFIPLVFERFRQADGSLTRRHGGLGIGLSIVKQLVELHGGTVQASSPGEGLGATFTVQLPVSAVHHSTYTATRPRPKMVAATPFKSINLSDVNVLVIDDQPDARALIERVLTECHARVVTAATADELLAILEAEKPDVLISDIGMPDVDGYELLRRVRALGMDRGGRVPAIALTAFARSEDRTRALCAGFQAHISKPVEPFELIATVASVAGRTD